MVVLFSTGAGLLTSRSAGGLSTACPAFLLIDSRGSGEPLGSLSPPGAAFSDVLRSLLAPTKLVRLGNPYPARGGFRILLGAKLHVPGAYFHSVKKGKAWLRSEIAEKSRDCPETKLILTGYSQGAQVAGDVLQRYGPFPNVAATVLFGDPYFNGRDPVDRGHPRFRTGVNGGLGKRPRFTENRVLSYCHSNDPVCQNTANPIALFTWHDNYDKLGEPAAAARTVAKWLGLLTLSPRGYGPVRFGMTLAEAEDALGDKPISVYPSVNDCGFWAFPGLAPNPLFGNSQAVAIGGKLTLFFPPPSVAANSGIRVGDTLAKLRATYPGRLRSTRTGVGGYGRVDKSVQAEYAVDQTAAGVRYTLDFAVDHHKVVWIAAGPWSWLKDWTECA